MELSVLCGRRIDNTAPDVRATCYPGGRLRIVDPTRGIVATLPIGVLDDPHGAVIGRS